MAKITVKSKATENLQKRPSNLACKNGLITAKEVDNFVRQSTKYKSQTKNSVIVWIVDLKIEY